MLKRVPWKKIVEGRKEKSPSKKNFTSWLPFLLLGIGIAIRLFYLFEGKANPLFLNPVLDAANYHRWALSIVNGRGGPEGVFTANPFYPYLLSTIYRFITQKRIFIWVIQIFVGVGACVFIPMADRYLMIQKKGINYLLTQFKDRIQIYPRFSPNDKAIRIYTIKAKNPEDPGMDEMIKQKLVIENKWHEKTLKNNSSRNRMR